jgi:adenylate cyclase
MAGSLERRLTADELALLAGSSPEQVAAATAAGLLTVDEDERFGMGDVHRMRILEAFLEADIPLDPLVRAYQAGVISFAYYDRLHAPVGPPSPRTYGALRDDLGDRAVLLGQLITALGLAEPEPDSRLPAPDEALLLSLLDIVADSQVPDLTLRVARLLGDAIRRASEAILTVYAEAADRLVGPVTGLPPAEVNERFLEPWNRYARLAPELGRWLTARHLSGSIDAFTVSTTESWLIAGGFIPERTTPPPAVAFIDLTGFTRMTEDVGDERAARTALRFGRLADRRADEHGGRLVKLLGDGALLRFGGPADGVEATLRLLDELEAAGLPRGHAGIDAGSIIMRDGDIFGRTVNRASRIADLAEAGELLAPTGIETYLPSGRYRLLSRGEAALQGVPEPVGLVRIDRA